ncbi:MAG: class I SAM-dependent methyltransferase [Micromonosporaceae bacterium]|nr:class I SAM-dependent methyltransferase [Micromonosporaceae bacterium]
MLDQVAALSPAGTILDLGCGPGSVALALAERGRDVIGADASPAMVDAARSAAARRQLLGTVSWLVDDAHRLAKVPPVAGAVIADAFHWFDRAAVLRRLDELVVPGGFVAVIVSFTAGTPKPWWYPLVDRVIDRHLGPMRQAGPGIFYQQPDPRDHERVLRDSAFGRITVTRTDHRIRLTLDQVMAWQYTQAYSSPAVLGDRLPAFGRDVRALLTAAEPSGDFTAVTQPGLIIAYREED